MTDIREHVEGLPPFRLTPGAPAWLLSEVDKQNRAESFALFVERRRRAGGAVNREYWERRVSSLVGEAEAARVWRRAHLAVWPAGCTSPTCATCAAMRAARTPSEPVTRGSRAVAVALVALLTAAAVAAVAAGVWLSSGGAR